MTLLDRYGIEQMQKEFAAAADRLATRQMTPEFAAAYQASMRARMQNAIPMMTQRELKEARDAASLRKRDDMLTFLIETGRA
jgi:hypothetical protein